MESWDYKHGRLFYSIFLLLLQLILPSLILILAHASIYRKLVSSRFLIRRWTQPGQRKKINKKRYQRVLFILFYEKLQIIRKDFNECQGFLSISGFLCCLLILSSFLHRSVNLPPDTNQSSVRQTRLSRQGIYIYYWRKRPVREGWGAPKKGFWLTTTFPSNETFLCNDSRKANKSIPYVGEDVKNMRPWILVITIHVIFKATKLHIIIYYIHIHILREK